ncbi:MAG: hypothetical protein V1664_05035 [Candidatus Uhrbacteria bacterium]
MDNQQPTNQDLAKAIKKLSKTTQDILCSVNKSFSEIEQKMNGFITKDELKFEFAKFGAKMDDRFDKVDEKIAETRGDLVSMLRKEDAKLGTLAGKLLKHKVLPTKSIREVLAMEPFPQSL